MLNVGLVFGGLIASEALFKLPSTATKKLRDWSSNDSNNNRHNNNNNNNNNNNSNSNYNNNGSLRQSPIPIQDDRYTAVHVISDRRESSTSLTRQMLYISSAVMVVYFAYSYYIGNTNTKRVIDKVEDTAQETQELVKECDDNNQKRIEELDERAEDRANELSIEIRGEQRAHFEVLSKQLNCVTQVCLQTITAIANGAAHSSEDGEIAQNDQLVAYAEKAQEMSDNLFDRDTYLKAVDMHMDECRAQIGNRKKSKMKGASTQPDMDDMMIAGGVTAGGSDDIDDELNYNSGSNNNNNPYVRKVSAPGMGRSDSKSSNKGNNDSKPKSVTELQFVKNLKLGYFTEYCTVKYVDPVYLFVREHQKLILGSLVLGLAAAGTNEYKKRQTKPKSYY